MLPRSVALTLACLLIATGFEISQMAPAGAATTTISVTVFTDTSVAGQCSLRDAVAAANAHATVHGCVGHTGAQAITLPAGTYPVTGGLTITTPVTITGANAGVDARATRKPESRIDFTATAATVLFSMTAGGGGSVFDGLALRGEFDAADPDGQINALELAAGAPTRGFTLTDSTVQGFTWALYISGTGETVTHDDFRGEVTGSGLDPSVISAYGNALYGDFPSTDLTVDDNRFAGYTNGAVIWSGSATSPATGFQIERNTVLDDNGLGFLVEGIDGATIANNWITASPAVGGIRGIVIAGASTHVTITQNTIDHQTNTEGGVTRGTGIRIRDDFGGQPNSTIVVHDNRVAGNTDAFFITAGTLSDTVDATGNWWGANAGVGGVGGNGTANGYNPAGVSTGVDAAAPLQLTVECGGSYVLAQAGTFAGSVASMPTWFTAAGHYATSWPLAGDPGDPLFTASATGATVSKFKDIVGGSGAETFGGTVAGTLTPSATTGSVSLGVDQEKITCAWTATPPAPALTLTKSNPATLVAGTPATYTLVLRNQGTGPATSATVLDELPSGFSYGSSRGATCTAKGVDVSCIVAGPLAAGSSTPFTITATPGASIAGTSVRNHAAVDPHGTASPIDPATCTGNGTADGCAVAATQLVVTPALAFTGGPEAIQSELALLALLSGTLLLLLGRPRTS